MQAIHTAYRNGAIRDSQGRLVAFYDAEAETLVRDGDPRTYGAVTSDEVALDLLAELERQDRAQ